MRRVFLLLMDSVGLYESYLKEKESLGSHELVVCCLTVSSIHYCEINNIDFVFPEDYFTDDELNCFSEVSHNKIRKMVGELNDYYHRKIGSVDGFLFDMGNYHFFMLYHFFGALHYRAFFLSKVIEQCDADRIIVADESAFGETERPFPVSQYKNCYMDLCTHSVYREKVFAIPVVRENFDQGVSLRKRIRRLLGKQLRKISVFNKYINLVQNSLPINLWEIVGLKSSADILLLGTAGPWKYVFADPAFRSRIGVFFESDEVTFSDHSVKDWFSEWFGWNDNFCGFNISALGYYEMARVKVLSEMIMSSHFRVMEDIASRKAVVFSVSPYASQQYRLSVAKFHGLPRVCFQHGEMSLYPNGFWEEASELMYLSHYFSYGDEVSYCKKKYMERSGKTVQTVSVGSPSLDKVKSDSSGSYILYASSKFIDYGAGFVSRYTDKAVMKNQSSLLSYFDEYIEENPERRVIWKRNQEYLTGQPVARTQKVEVIQDEDTFLSLLPNAEVVILDRPSTTAVEACITYKPLFVLLASRNWFSFPETLLRKRAVIAYTPEALLEAVDRYLREGIYPADVKNREFVRAFGCHLDDGGAVRRAKDELMRIISQS